MEDIFKNIEKSEQIVLLPPDEEWIDVMITDQGSASSGTPGSPRAIIDGWYPMENVGHEAVKILDPVTPESENIQVTLDERFKKRRSK